VWKHIKGRCYNRNKHDYKHYGGRGITVCDEWQDFLPFYEWAMANGYTENLTIDRIDNNGNYEPSNCRWATMNQQNVNKRTNTDFAGVSFDKRRKRFNARLMVRGKYVTNRMCKTAQEAILARIESEKQHGILIERNNKHGK
jgi:hypothetical protein